MHDFFISSLLLRDAGNFAMLSCKEASAEFPGAEIASPDLKAARVKRELLGHS